MPGADLRLTATLQSRQEETPAALAGQNTGLAPGNPKTHPMKILVVEDEAKTGDYLRQGLSEAGFVVDLARYGTDGAHLATTDDYDLVVLDVMLPGLDGWGVMRRIREAGRTMPVLFLTARGQVDDRVKGLELGADDYLLKPFAFSELLARVRTLLRRGRARSPRSCAWPTWSSTSCAGA